MKKIIALLCLTLSMAASASNLRQLCEDAYYANAGGVQNLHQYSVVAEFGVMSDSQYDQIDELLFGDNGVLNCIAEKSFNGVITGKALHSIILKENADVTESEVNAILDKIASFPGVTVNCR